MDFLDYGRRWLLQHLVQVPGIAAGLKTRDRRLVLQTTLGALSTFVLTIFFPALLFALGPLIFGVAHVASDVRYLILRRHLPQRGLVALTGWILAFVALHALERTGRVELPYDRLDVLLAGLGIVTAALVSQPWEGGGRRRIVAWCLVGGALLLWADAHAGTLRLGFAHAHNGVALLLWLMLFRQRRWILWPSLALLASALLLFASGAAGQWAQQAGGLVAAGMDLRQGATWLAPGFAPAWALGVTLSYIYLQALHYAVWLQWLPQEEIKGQGTLSFRMSWRSLQRDFRPYGLLTIVILTVAVLFGAWGSSVALSRSVYLSLASFHGYLELTMLTFFFLRRRSLVTFL